MSDMQTINGGNWNKIFENNGIRHEFLRSTLNVQLSDHRSLLSNFHMQIFTI